MRRSKRLRPWFGLTVVAAGALVALTPAAVLARSNATPVNTAPPTVTGTEREGQTLTAGNGTWSNNPTSFEYKWQRCTIDGTACGDIAGATEKTYKPVQGDVGHALAVIMFRSPVRWAADMRAALHPIAPSTLQVRSA